MITLSSRLRLMKPSQERRRPVSHLGINPPEWVRLSHEPCTPPFESIPPTIPIDSTARCTCGSSVRDPTSPIVTASIRVFGLQYARSVDIEMIKCTLESCRSSHQRYLIPDCSKYGLMIWSKNIALEHDLLFDYLSQLSRSETPMIAFVLSTRQRYTHSYSSKSQLSAPHLQIPLFSYATFSRVSRSSLAVPATVFPDSHNSVCVFYGTGFLRFH